MTTKAQRRALFDVQQRERIVERLEAAKDEIQDLWLNRHIWRTTANIAGSSATVAEHPFFMYWVASQYAQTACVAIRRLTESGPNAKTTNSLVAVLEDLIANSRSHPWQPWVPSDYRAGDGSVEPQRVQRDIDDLRRAAQAVSAYVNKHLAHLERTPNVSIPTVVELDQAIDLLGEVLHRYLLLTTGGDLEITPKVLFNWTAVFDRPWRTAGPAQGGAG